VEIVRTRIDHRPQVIERHIEPVRKKERGHERGISR
jgi:hypothetical protein